MPTKRAGATLMETARFDVVTFTVTGRVEFPLDMLRYDRCWPMTASDADTIRTATGPRPAADHTVTLQSVGFTSPTIRRWESFGWTVVDPTTSTI